MTKAEEVIAACEASWDMWQADCSGFVRAVAQALGVSLTGQANQLILHCAQAPDWQCLGRDAHSATLYANNGYLVLGGLADQPHGHVLVIVQSVQGAYPLAYWGRLGGIGRKNTGINWSWNKADLPRVQFFAYPR